MKAIMGVVVPTPGEVLYEGRSLAGVSVAERCGAVSRRCSKPAAFFRASP
jgi:hypothetical protein